MDPEDMIKNLQSFLYHIAEGDDWTADGIRMYAKEALEYSEEKGYPFDENEVLKK